MEDGRAVDLIPQSLFVFVTLEIDVVSQGHAVDPDQIVVSHAVQVGDGSLAKGSRYPILGQSERKENWFGTVQSTGLRATGFQRNASTKSEIDLIAKLGTSGLLCSDCDAEGRCVRATGSREHGHRERKKNLFGTLNITGLGTGYHLNAQEKYQRHLTES